MNSNEKSRGGRESRESATGVEMNALEYALAVKRDRIAEQIETKLREDSLEERWLRVVANGDAEAIEQFQKKFKSPEQLRDFVRARYFISQSSEISDSSSFVFTFQLQLGLIKGSELGSSRLIDYFIGSQKLDLNYILDYKVQ